MAEVVKGVFVDVLFAFVAVAVAAGCSWLAGAFVNFLFELRLSECVVQLSDYFVIWVVVGVREVGCGSCWLGGSK